MGDAAVARREGDRLRRRRHDRVPARRGRLVLLHGDEHPHPGRASGHRDGDRHRPGEGADPRRRRRAAVGARSCRRCAATRSSAASTPRIRRATSSRRPGRSTRTIRRAGRACASTRTSTPATRCRRTTTRCSPSSSCQGRDRAGGACAGCRSALDSFIIEGVTTTIPFLARVMQNPRLQSRATSTPSSSSAKPELFKEPG